MIHRLTTLNSSLLIIDVQERLLTKMPDAPGLIRDVGFLMDVAKLLGLPLFATEQYPKGLGPTSPTLLARLSSPIPAKVAFSCCGAPGLLADLRASGRSNVVLAGMETHVCVLQTALDLLDEGMGVFVPVNAVQTRFDIDHTTALHRMERAGVILTTVEMTAFEWLGSADHPQFKTVSKLIQERGKAC